VTGAPGRGGGGFSGARGSVSLLAAGLMVIAVVLAVGCADVARTLTAASAAQTAADAAALAAAQELALPSGGTTPGAVAADYAARDGAELVSCDCDPGASVASVVVRRQVGSLLLFGAGRFVTARARAEVDLPG
jgi:Flp pilus assembly protein TadG